MLLPSVLCYAKTAGYISSSEKHNTSMYTDSHNETIKCRKLLLMKFS